MDLLQQARAVREMIDQNAILASNLTKTFLESDAIPDEEKETFTANLPMWSVGTYYIKGSIIQCLDDSGTSHALEVLSTHTARADKLPLLTGNLYRPFIDPTKPAPYKAMMYRKGERVLYKDRIYESLMDNNSFLPTTATAWKLVS